MNHRHDIWLASIYSLRVMGNWMYAQVKFALKYECIDSNFENTFKRKKMNYSKF